MQILGKSTSKAILQEVMKRVLHRVGISYTTICHVLIIQRQSGTDKSLELINPGIEAAVGTLRNSTKDTI